MESTREGSSSDRQPDPPRLTHVCLVTNDVHRLARFYAEVLACRADMHGDQYAEVSAPGCTVSFFRADAMERLAPGAATAGANRSMLLEFRVADVDAEYERLQETGVRWVKPPSTQPWGNRSIYFTDPDGNLVNFYTKIG